MSNPFTRSIVFPIRFNQMEMEVIGEAAGLDLRTPTEWMRNLVVDTAKKNVRAARERDQAASAE